MRINHTEFDCTIEDIIQRLRLELNKRGSSLLAKSKKSTNYLMVSCPYHGNGIEKHPSAQFRDSDGLFYCFACKKSYPLVKVISDLLHEDGWSWLVRNFKNISLENRKIELNFGTNKTEKPKYIPYEDLAKYRYYHPYMWKRKLTKEIVHKFDIGYDKENDCLTFPVKDINGNILFIATRSVKEKKFSYPKDAQIPIYGLYELETEKKNGKQINEVYIVESMLDALAIWGWGKYAVALNGTGHRSQIKELNNYNCKCYILATDNDDAGKYAREKLKEGLVNKIVKELSYDSYNSLKDINDMSKEQFLNAKIIWGALN